MTKGGTKHYVRSDGNGGYNISKSVIGFGTVIMILAMLIPAVAYVTTMNGKIEQLEQVWRDVRVEHPEYVRVTEKRIDTMEKDHVLFKAEVMAMHDDIQEIKVDLRDIKDFTVGGAEID